MFEKIIPNSLLAIRLKLYGTYSFRDNENELEILRFKVIKLISNKYLC